MCLQETHFHKPAKVKSVVQTLDDEPTLCSEVGEVTGLRCWVTFILNYPNVIPALTLRWAERGINARPHSLITRPSEWACLHVERSG